MSDPATPPAPALSVVVPVFNEVDTIEPLVAEIEGALATVDHELLFVDDGSGDGTALRLATAMARFPRLRVLRHLQNAGQSTAIATGVRAARADWVATLDGDGQNPPAEILKLIARRDAGGGDAAMVAGIRVKRQDNWVRKISSRVGNGVRSRLLGDDTPDTGCGLKLFRRELFLALPYFDHMHRFLPALVKRQGGAVLLAEVGHRPRERGQSKYGVWNRLWVSLVDLAGVMWLQRRMRRPGVAELPRS